MGGVDVADLEPRALPREAAGPEGRDAALVRHLGERVGLVHELGELGGAEELLDDRRDGLGVDDVVRHQRLDVLQPHLLADRPLHPDQPHPELVLDELADRAHAPVPEVVDVVRLADAVLEVDEVPDDPQDVVLRQHGVVEVPVRDAQLVVQLQTARRGRGCTAPG